MMDQLTVANLRIWFAENVKRKIGATDKEIADATRVTNVTNKLRTDLIQGIDEALNHMCSTGELQSLYKQGDSKTYG